MSALWPVQVAAVTRWKGHDPLMDRVTGVFDGVAPPNTKKPYITVGTKTEVPVGAMGASGSSATMTADIWSDYDGDKEALEILSLMNDALAEPLPLDGHTMARLRPEFTTTLREGNDVRHVPVRYRIATFKAP